MVLEEEYQKVKDIIDKKDDYWNKKELEKQFLLQYYCSTQKSNHPLNVDISAKSEE